MKTRIALVAALASAAAALLAVEEVLAAGKQRPEPRWALSWEAALAEAKERNVPIVVNFHQDL